MNPVPKIHVENYDVRDRLAQLGLTPEILDECLRRGQAAWAACTLNHPPIARGFYRWSEMVVGFREEMLRLGWKRCNEGNLPFTVSPDGKVAVAVSSGDEDTGIAKGSPCTNSSKGPRTHKAVTVNQYRLFDQIELLPPDLRQFQERETWILLSRLDLEAECLRAELSRPISMNEDGRVDGWAERIILATVPLSSDDLRLPTEDEEEIVVEVEKRG